MKTRFSGPYPGAAILAAGLLLSGSSLAAATPRFASRAKVVVRQNSAKAIPNAGLPDLGPVAQRVRDVYGTSNSATLDLSPLTHECTPRSISCGQSASGTLTEHTCTTSTAGSYGLVYFFSGVAGMTVTAGATSDSFDTLLGLVDPISGNLVVVDDNGGRGTNSSFAYTLPSTGAWALSILNRNLFATGPFTLSLACAAATSYSVEVPVVTRVQGTALFRTAIDISNNTGNAVTARYQYSYNRFNPDGTKSFFNTPVRSISLLGFDNFHTDDFVQYLGSFPGVLQPGAEQSSFGTLLVTFENLSSSQGWEGAVYARTYSPNPTGPGTVAIAYPASLFFESANQTLVATIRDTQTAPDIAGALRTNIGIRNTDILGSGQHVNVQLEFYDVTTGSPTSGQRVGNILTISDLEPGEVEQINNIRTAAVIPANVTAMLVFADVAGATATAPTIEGYVNILDGGTQDGAYFEMRCADPDGCGN